MRLVKPNPKRTLLPQIFSRPAVHYSLMLTLRRASAQDVAILAQMNQRLIEDEGASGLMASGAVNSSPTAQTLLATPSTVFSAVNLTAVKPCTSATIILNAILGDLVMDAPGSRSLKLNAFPKGRASI
jgi:hypothetical protein